MLSFFFFHWLNLFLNLSLLLDTVTHLARSKDNGIASKNFWGGSQNDAKYPGSTWLLFPRCCAPRLHRNSNEFANYTCFWPPVDTWCVQAKLGVCVWYSPRAHLPTLIHPVALAYIRTAQQLGWISRNWRKLHIQGPCLQEPLPQSCQRCCCFVFECWCSFQTGSQVT